MKAMHILKDLASISLALLSVGAVAQTPVTNGNDGTSNTVPVYIGSATLGNSPITVSGSNVGIGTPADLSYGLSISTGIANERIKIHGSTSSGLYLLNSAGTDGATVRADATSFQIYPTNATPAITILNSNSNVGIGTTSPSYLLDVSGAGRFSGALYALGFGGTGATFTPIASTTSTRLLAYTGLVAGNYNYIVQNNDAALIYDINGTLSTGSFVIAPHANGPSGMRFDASGSITSYSNMFLMSSVGIGTTAPVATNKLEVSGNIALTSSSGGSIVFQDGSKQNTAWTGVVCGGDYAESVDVTGDRKKYEPGDVLVIASEESGDVAKSSEAYSTSVVGIYSTKPGTVGRRQAAPKSESEVPMAMIGIVPTKVSAENGPIHRGDLLVSSSKPGYAMKGTDRMRLTGAVVGKALGHLDSGTGVIEVVVTLQ